MIVNLLKPLFHSPSIPTTLAKLKFFVANTVAFTALNWCSAQLIQRSTGAALNLYSAQLVQRSTYTALNFYSAQLIQYMCRCAE